VKLLLDQGLPRTAPDALARLGFAAVHAGAIGMARASDSDILDRARREGEIVVTLDADFHAVLALSNAGMPSVIRIRVEGLRADDVAAIVSRVVAVCEADLTAGAMVTVDPDRIRVRRLPLIHA
jgi:predicted nuclease of predicted toxin-antitoxin system